jgi:hypothetical protein
MPNAFGQGMALGFQALSAQRQREESERKQETFDLLMQERNKDIRAQDAVKNFMVEAGDITDPDALRSLLNKRLPNFLDSPTAVNQAIGFVRTNPLIMQQNEIGKLDRTLAQKQWEMGTQQQNALARLDYAHNLKMQGGGGTGLKGGSAKALPEYPKREMKAVNVIVGRDAANLPIYEQRSVFADTGVETHKLSPGGVPVLNPDDPIVQQHYGKIDDVRRALRLLKPDLTEEQVNEAAHLAYNSPSDIIDMKADYNRLVPFMAPKGTPKVLRYPSTTGGPEQLVSLSGMRGTGGLSRFVQMPGMEPTSKPITQNSVDSITGQPKTVRGMAELMFGLGGGSQEAEPTLADLSPGRWEPSSEIYREKIWNEPGTGDTNLIYNAPVVHPEIYRSSIPSEELYRAPVAPLAEYRAKMPRNRLDLLRAAIPKNTLK